MIQVFTKAMFCSAVIYGLFAAVHAQQRNPCDDEGGYDYPTKLKGEYRLVFETDREIKYLNLYKGIRRIRRLSDVSCGLPNKNLGYIGTDFQNYFVLVHSFRSGNPHEIELIRKSDGKKHSRPGCLLDRFERKVFSATLQRRLYP